MKKPALLMLSAFLMAVILSSCSGTKIFYFKDNKVNAAITNEKNPPDKAFVLNQPIDVGNWRLDALSASPDGKFLALGMIKIGSPIEKTDGKLEVYRNSGQSLAHKFDDNDLKALIENSANLNYPSQVYAFHPYALGYESEDVLIVHVQPQSTTESLPQDVRLKINLRTKELTEKVSFFSRTNRPPFPTHASKNRYNFEVINGKMYVNGKLLDGMPSGLHKDLHDEVKLKK